MHFYYKNPNVGIFSMALKWYSVFLILENQLKYLLEGFGMEWYGFIPKISVWIYQGPWNI
jgi:hypothetical protein